MPTGYYIMRRSMESKMTYAIHILTHLETSEVLFRMYWCEGKDIGALEILVAAALEVGLEQSSVTTYLKSSDDSAEIRKREQSWRVSGVPFFMINKQYNESGMQSVKRFEEVFSKIAQQ